MCCITIISAYGPPITSLDEVKDKVYEELDSLIIDVLKLDMLGDINSHILMWERIIKPEIES